MSEMIYAWGKGYPNRGVEAAAAGQELERIHAKYGSLTTDDVVEESRPKRAPLHPLIFRLTDKEAAERWRREEAQQLIAHIRVLQDGDPDAEPERVYINVVEDGESCWMTTAQVLTDQQRYTYALLEATRLLNSVRKRFSWIHELRGVFAELDKLEAD